jgi:hypothetical protein
VPKLIVPVPVSVGCTVTIEVVGNGGGIGMNVFGMEVVVNAVPIGVVGNGGGIEMNVFGMEVIVVGISVGAAGIVTTVVPVNGVTGLLRFTTCTAVRPNGLKFNASIATGTSAVIVNKPTELVVGSI